MILQGTALVIEGDNIDTDVMYPGAYLNIEDPEQMKPYLFEGFDPSLRDQFGGDTVVVVGANFGIGSSREHVPQGMKAWGVRCLVGKSFARIFYRNCINLGLPAVVCPDAVEAARPDSSIRIDTDSGTVEVDERRFEAESAPPFVDELLDSGGLVAWVRDKLAGTLQATSSTLAVTVRPRAARNGAERPQRRRPGTGGQ